MATRLPHRKIVGGNIRNARKQAGLTLERLAERADLSWAYLSEIENGKENISLDALARVAQALKTTICSLTSGA